MSKDLHTQCSCRRDDQYERIVWLTYPGKRIDAFRDFEALADVERKTFWKTFQYWMGGFPPNRRKHHGWTDARYRGCYVFKNGEHRLYGFLHHSARGKDSDLCIICIYAKKKGDYTDPGILDRLNGYRNDKVIIDAVLALKDQKEML